jgi:hypothetical protein
VGSLGAKSSKRKITKLINRRTGMVKINLLIVYFNMAVSQFGSLKRLDLLPRFNCQGSKMIILVTIPIGNVPKFTVPCILDHSAQFI